MKKVSLKDIPHELFLEHLDGFPQFLSLFGQSGSLFIEICIESLLEVLHLPFQIQKLVFEINGYANWLVFL